MPIVGKESGEDGGSGRESRRVWTRQLEDGMGLLALTHEWSTIRAIQAAVTADGRALQLARRAAAEQDAQGTARTETDEGTGSTPPAATDTAVDAADAGRATETTVDDMDTGEPTGIIETLADAFEEQGAEACRADALAARILGEVSADGTIDWDRSQVPVTVNVVIDLDTLRGEADNVALLDGQPVPPALGREVAEWATAWRRLLTDPITGHLLDYGRTQYLPGPLRRLELARDAGCRTPCCTVHAESRLQLDHAEEWPTGPSDTANCGTHCTTCHQLKTAGYADITDSQPDGSHTWCTAWGQVIHVPPHPVLPAAPDPDPPPTEYGEPPF